MAREATPNTARSQFGAMVRELLTACGVTQRGAARLVPDGRLSETALRRWCKGERAPDSADILWELVEQLEHLQGRLPHTRQTLEAALAAAQAEADRGRRVQKVERDEQMAIDDFVRDDGPFAPAYLWWHAELPVGKTKLLASYGKDSPEGIDALFCGVSGERGTNTRAGFAAALHELAQVSPRQKKGSAEDEFKRLLARAAAKSQQRKRLLVLVIDDLDADVAWPVTGTGEAPMGSIAALLPTTPPTGVRIIVSSRRSTPLPADLPAHHPLRLRECLRLLTPGSRSVEVEQTSRAGLGKLRAVELGRTVTDLLAITDGELRTTDLAHLTGASVEEVANLLAGRESRCIVQDDTLTGTYTLSHAGMPESIRAQLDGPATEHYHNRLHDWAAEWSAAGWPESTPPYLLTAYPHLLDRMDRLGPLLLDPQWQLRVADALGPEPALRQLHDFTVDFTDHLGPAVRLTAARDFLQRRVHRVLPRAPVIFALLGDIPRARTVAQSDPELVVRAARLADVAVEAARAWHPDAADIVMEAAECVLRAGQFTPAAGSLEGSYDEVAEAAATLTALGRKPEARTLYRAMALSGATDVETLARAASLLSETDGTDHLAELERHAERVSTLGLRAQAVAVDTWATIAGVSTSRGVANADRIQALCRGLATAEGLPVVDVLALGASALAGTTGRTKQAQDVLMTARACLAAALTSPSPEDRAHQERALSGTMERFVRAEAAVGFGRAPHLDAKKLVLELDKSIRTGVLGDDLLERAKAYLSAIDEQLAAEDAADAAARREEKLAARRAREEKARALAEERAAYKRPASPRRQSRPTSPVEGEESKPTDAARRKPAVAAHEDEEQESPPFRPVTPLENAEHLVRIGNLELGREQLELALRSSHPSTPALLSDRCAEELIRALGTVGEFEQAERLVRATSVPSERARRFAALSVGCALGEHRTEATANALAASRLVERTARFTVKAAVAQALAYAGDADGAEAMAKRAEPVETGPSALRTHRATAIVAAGLVHGVPHHDPDVTRSGVEMFQRLINRLPNPLPLVAPLLLAHPEPRNSNPELSELLELATRFVHQPRQTWDPESALLLAVLRRLGLSLAPDRPAEELDVWLRALRPERVPHAGLALLSALDGNIAEVRRLSDDAPSPAARARALATAAHALSGAPAPLFTEEEPEDGTLRLCLALTHACTARLQNSDDHRATAHALVHDLLAGGEWTQVIPLLPVLAPEALPALGDLAVAHICHLRP